MWQQLIKIDLKNLYPSKDIAISNMYSKIAIMPNGLFLMSGYGLSLTDNYKHIWWKL